MASFGAMAIVEPSGPLASGGIFYLHRPSPRDASQTLDGRWTTSVADAYAAAALAPSGRAVLVVILRDGQELTLSVTPRPGI
jgi:S1-C subfamily serine protease